MEKMGDARRIDHLRALALSSMPSVARRPVQRRNSGSIDAVEQRKPLVSALHVLVADDKEEGELSSDDETEPSATPLGAVESSFSFAHRNSGLSIRAPIQGKDERHAAAATSAGSVPLVGVSFSSVFSTSTRVSIVNKSQLFSAFTAQAPPLLSSEPREPGIGIAVPQYKHALPEINSSCALLPNPYSFDSLSPNPYSSGALLSNPYDRTTENPLPVSQLIPPPNLPRSFTSATPRSGLSITLNSPVGRSTQSQIHVPVISPRLKSPDPPTAVSAVSRSSSAVPFSAAANAGADISKALGAAPARSVSASPIVGGAGLRKEGGAGKEADAFLASLRIPLANSAASGDEKEDSFLIKFDEDSESDGENETRTNSSRRPQGRSSQKRITNSGGPVSTSLPLQSTPVMATQSPVDLTAEIDRMKKQIAEMERTKGKTSIPSVLGKARRAFSTDTQRNVLTPATEPRPGTYSAIVNARPASVDLESMRLRIAAKESELKQRRQRLAVKVPESGRGVSDPKITGGVLASSVPPTTRLSQAADSADGKSSSERGISECRKEVLARSDGIPALALAGPAGDFLVGFKKDAEQRGLDGSKDDQRSNGPVPNVAFVPAVSHLGRVWHQPASKGMKRSRAEEVGCELAKASKCDNNSVSEKLLVENSLKKAALPSNINDTPKSGRILSSGQTAKRKADAGQVSSDKAVPGCPIDRVSAAGSEATKKLKTNSGAGLIHSIHYGGGQLSLSSKQHAHMKNQHVAQGLPPYDVLLSSILPREKMKSAFPRSDIALKTTTGATPDMIDGKVRIRDVAPAVSLSSLRPVVTERERSSNVPEALPIQQPIRRPEINATNMIDGNVRIGDVEPALSLSPLLLVLREREKSSSVPEALPIQRATRGTVAYPVSPSTFGDSAVTASLTQPIVKARDFEQPATCTTVAVTECQQVTLGRLNPNNTFSTENNSVHSTQPWKLFYPVSSANLNNETEHLSHSRIDNGQLDGEYCTFQQLLEEEELLDKQLEDVQRIRQQCEVRERNARREYREAQWALRVADADCYSLNQRKELLLSRIHAAEARHLPGKSSTNQPFVPFGSAIVTRKQNRPEPLPLLVSAPYPLPTSQALEGSQEEDVDRGRSTLVRDNLGPFPSNQVDLAAFPYSDAHFKLAKNFSSDDKEQESNGQLIAGVESRKRWENDSAVGGKEVQAGVVTVEKQVGLETRVSLHGASQDGNQCYARSESHLNNDRSRNSPLAGLDVSGPGGSDLSRKGHNSAVRKYASETRVEELRHGQSPEESGQVPLKSLKWITIECSKQTAGICSVDDVSVGVSRMGGISEVCTEDNRCLVPDVKVTVEGTIQDVSTEIASPGTHAVPIHFKDCNIGASSVEFSDQVKDRDPDVFATSMPKEYVGQVHPERSCSVQETPSLENKTRAVGSCLISREHAEEGPSDPEHSLSRSISQNLQDSSEARDEIEPSNFESLLEGPGDNIRLMTELHQCSNHLPPLAIDTRDDQETNPHHGDLTYIKTFDASLSDREQEPPVIIDNPSSKEAPPNSDAAEPKAQTIDESSGRKVFATHVHASSTPDDPVLLDLDEQKIQHVMAVESREGVTGMHLAGDAEWPNGANDGENNLAPRPGSVICSLKKELDRGVFGRDFLGVAESAGFIMDNFLSEKSAITIKDIGHNTLIIPNQYCLPSSEEKDPQCDNSFVTQLADTRSLNYTGLQGCADILEGQHHDASDVLPEPNLKMSFDDNSATEGSNHKEVDPVQDGDTFTRGIVQSEMIADNSEVLNENELGSQEHNPAIAAVAKGQRQDQLDIDVSESGEQKQEGAEKQESNKGADVEVFRKALLDGNMFERRSTSGEAEDTTHLTKQNQNEVSKQILPQLQQHRLAHLLEMVEVRVPELSSGGDILIQKGIQGEMDTGCPVAVDHQQLDTPAVEIHDIVVPSDDQALSSGMTCENVRDTAKHWVPSADSLAVLRFIPILQPSLSDTGCEMGSTPSSMGEKVSFETSVALPYRYESPLSIFRSYRICPQFFHDLHLSHSSKTWSHAINPFKALCKFEHRGKCNNDDCPWQHVDDYTLSSSQILSQMQNYVDPKGMISEDHDVAATSLYKNRELTMACVSLPTRDSPVTSTQAKAPLADPGRTSRKSSILPVSSRLDRNHSEVPIYSTGSYTLRAEDPMRMCLLSHSLQLDRACDSLRSFLLSPSRHRPLPPDIPCLLDASETSSWLAPAYHPGSPHERYMRDIQEKLMFTKGSCLQDVTGSSVLNVGLFTGANSCDYKVSLLLMEGLTLSFHGTDKPNSNLQGDAELQESIDEETWLELALHHIDYNLSIDNNKARDQALFYLSRALESKQSSVTLWVVYSCLFHMRKDNPDKDDMFHHAVQYNPGSYELWVLYINSRSDFQSRLDAYEKAIVALVNEGTQLQLESEELSACVLDIGLQMLYFCCVSGCLEDSSLWVDDLVYESSAQDDVRKHRGSTRALLSHLTKHDACVLWIACTYLLACKHLPNSIITRLGCKQELPDCLEWEKYAKLDELSHKRVMKALTTAASEGLGCLSLGSAQVIVDKENFSRQMLGVNYIQCLALYEGLDSAACFGKKMISLHPTSLDLIIVCARIDEHRKGFIKGLHVFEEAVSRWPHDLPGMQSLWNQYAGHALLWGGKDFAKTILLDCAATRNLSSIIEVEVSRRMSTQAPFALVSLDKAERSDGERNTVEGWSHLREYFVTLTSVCKRSEGGTISSHQLSQVEDTVFSLMNLALVEALSGDIASCESAINSAMKAAVSHKDLRHCWRELAAFHQVFCAKSVGWGESKMLEHGMLSFLDRCKTDSYNLSQLRPLSEKVFQNYKKPHVRKFLEDLIGPPPSDHSVLNSVLRTLYGPRMLPSDTYPLKEVFRFAEGILEAVPGNVLLASSLCKIVGHGRRCLKRMYMPAVMWATALLTSTLHQSCPVAPEVYWVEAGLLLRQLDEERSLEEFYKLALLKYPFSAALRHCLQEVQDQLQVPDMLSLHVHHKSLKLVPVEPMQVAVEC